MVHVVRVLSLVRREQAKMVHVVHHFVDGGTANRSEWRTWYTISWAERLKVSQNGACSAPFCRWRDSKQVRMVYVVHHFMGRRLKVSQNGACSAPSCRWRDCKQARMVHVVHHFSDRKAGNGPEWCTWYAVLSLVRRETG